VKFKLEGIAALSKALQKYDKDTGRAYARGLGGVARAIYVDADAMVPVDTGALRESGDYWIEGTGWRSVGYVGYGFAVEGFERTPANYAVFQHDLPFERKWLEDAVENQADDASYLFWQELSSV
jgi:hypothetical protein